MTNFIRKAVLLAVAAVFMAGSKAHADSLSDNFEQQDGYYLIQSVADLLKLSEISNTETTLFYYKTTKAKFRLTADLDMSGVTDFVPICYTDDNDKSFGAPFDGQGHTISNLTITTTNTTNFIGLFSLVFGGLVENLCMKNTVINNNGNAAVARGAIIGRNGSSQVRNCCVWDLTVNEGQVTEGTTSSTGSICGYMSSSTKSIMSGCFTNYMVLCGRGAKAIIEDNCFAGTDATSRAATGELCYLLNRGSDNPVWYQTLGEGGDPYPVQDATHGIVYQTADQTCDGTPKGTAGYSNTPSGKRDPHTLVDGVCSVCNAYNPDDIVDGTFMIGSAAQLRWFANYVNQGTTYRNTDGKLTADIDLQNEPFTPIASSVMDNTTARDNTSYGGNFDGQGHTIRNLKIVGKDDGNVSLGLFSRAYSKKTTTLKNIFLENVDIYTEQSTAVSIGGIVGHLDGVIVENCGVVNISIVHPNFTSASTARDGGVCGYMVNNSYGHMINCYTNYEIYGYKTASPTVINSYAKEDFDAKAATGELCYLLNGDQSTIVWKQNLTGDADAYPVLDPAHKTVYLNGHFKCDGVTPAEGVAASYSNEEGNRTVEPHQFVDGVCTVCGESDGTWFVDGIYQISTPAQLVWFSAYVNQGNQIAKAKLMKDIDMAEVENFTPIGLFGDNASCQKTYYKGTFDGQGHIIYNLKVNEANYHECGLFSRVRDGAVVKNLGVVNADITTTNDMGGRAGVIAGFLHDADITNCFSAGDIKITGLNGSDSFGGLYGGNSKGRATNCWSTYEGPLAIGGTFTNCQYYSINPNIASDALTGRLAWTMNGGQFLEPTWFQTIGTDEYPVLDPTHGLVYENEGEMRSVQDEESYAEFRSYLVEKEKPYAETVIACQATIDQFTDKLDELMTIGTLAGFLPEYVKAMELKNAVKTSEKAYAEYIGLCNGFAKEIAEYTGHSAYIATIEDYLDPNNLIEPGEYPNGNFTYIIDTHTLTDSQIAEEMNYISKLMNRLVISNPQPGTEMTVLLDNADFSEGWNHWTVTGNAGMAIGGEKSVLTVARGLDGSFSVSQKIEGLPNGIYEMQMNGFSRAGNDINSKLYTGQLFLNDVSNYVMTVGEDYVSDGEAEDGVNCHLTGSSIDVSYYDEASGESGYVPSYMVGCSYAYKAGRYLNRVAVEVKDSTITIGVRDLKSTASASWLPFAGIRLFYLGNADEANDRLDDVLDGYVARATTIRDFTANANETYTLYPNISNQLKEQIAACITARDAAGQGAEKMALIEKFSKLFDEVYDCRLAYVELGAAADRLLDIATNMQEYGIINKDEYGEMITKSGTLWNEFVNGNLSAGEARELAASLNEMAYTLNKDENGIYQIATARDLQIFSFLVNNTDNTAPAVLTDDIDLSDVQNFIPIGLYGDKAPAKKKVGYKGIFDGQGHVIRNLMVDTEDDIEGGLFSRLNIGAVVKNLGVENASIATNNSEGRAGAIVGYNYVCTLTNCFSTGTITFINTATDQTTYNGGIVGCSRANSRYVNCWSTYEGRLDGNESASVRANCHYYTMNPNIKDDAQSGKLCYDLNLGAGTNVFYQTLGTDTYPVLDPTHKVVILKDGVYCNDEGSAIKGITASQDTNATGVYDLRGLRVTRPTKGLYIVNGRKVVIR